MDQRGLSSRAIVGRIYEVLEMNKDKFWPTRLGMKMPSNQESETYKWLGMSPAMREWIGGRHPVGLRENGITIKNKKFETTLEIDEDDHRRDKTGQIDIRIGEMTDRVVQHWAKLLSALILNGESTVCYDGQYFFDTDHSEGDSGTLSNDLSASDYSELNVSTATDPTPDELAKIILKMIQHMYSFKDDRGEPINENALKFGVMVPVPFFSAAVQAVYSKFLATGSGVRDNMLAAGQKPEDMFSVDMVIHNARLTWTTKLVVFRLDGRTKPFILQEEEAMTAEVLGVGSEHTFKTGKELYGVKALRNVGYGYWQHACLATLS